MRSTEVNDLGVRVRVLETRLRRTGLTAAAAVVITVLSVSSSVQSQQPAPDVLRAKKLVIVDDKGVERIILGAPVPDPKMGGKVFQRRSPANGISINDAKGDERGGFGMLDDGTMVLMLDHDGEEGAGLFILPDGTCGVHIAHKKKLAAADLVVGADGSAKLTLGPPEKDQAVVQVDKDGNPSVKLRKKDGATAFEEPK